MRTGLREGDRVALLVSPSLEYLDVVIGLLAAGVVPIPLDPRLTTFERERILAGLSPTLAGHDRRAARGAAGGATRTTGGCPAPGRCTARAAPPGRRRACGAGRCPTSTPPHCVAEERSLWGFADSDVNLVLSPLYHSAPLRFAMGTALAGGRVVVPGQFDPALVTEAIERERPTSMFCVPTHLQRLFAHWDEVGTPDLSSFRLVAHAGAPCPDAVKRRLVETFPEGVHVGVLRLDRGPVHRLPLRGVARAARDRGPGPARPGAVDRRRRHHLVRGAAVRPVLLLRRPRQDGRRVAGHPDGPAFTVGDLGRLDDDGYLFLDGRREDLVISGGVNVYPLEVEQVLLEHPGVDDVAVYGVPDEQWGQRVCAAYVGAATAGRARRLRPRAAGAAQAAQDLAPARPTCPAPSPGRCCGRSCRADGLNRRIDGQSPARSRSGKRRWTAS